MNAAAGVELALALRVLTDHGATLLRPGAGGGDVTDVVLQAPGDPAPGTGAVVLWADVDGPAPASVAVVLRASQAAAADRLAAGCAVLTVPDGERWAQVHERLRAVVLTSGSGPDLFATADALATAIGGAVAIEDVARRILAFSTVLGQPIDEVRRQGILGRRVPEHVEREQWYARLWRSSAPIHFEAGPESSPRLALGLRSGGERVGSVWVVGDRRTLQPDSEATLVASAPAVAAAVLAQTGTSGRTREQRGRLLARVLDEPAGPDLDPLLPAVVVGISCPAGSELDDLVRARLGDLLSLQSQRREGTGLAGEVGGDVLALLPWTAEERIEVALGSLLRRTGAEGLSAVVSEPVPPGASLHEAHAQVRSLLSLQSRPGDPEVRFAARSRPLVQLVRLGEALAARDGVASGGGAAVVAHDAEHGTAYAESLLAWFAAHGDVARAAARLHIHANTLRYRWNRCVHLFDLDLEDGDARLLLHLELRLRALGYADTSTVPLRSGRQESC